MITRRAVVQGGVVAGISTVLPVVGRAAKPGHGVAYILGATAVTQVYGDGQRLTGIAIEQDRPVDPASLDPSLYRVDGRTIVRVSASDRATPRGSRTGGGYIVIDLSPDDADARLFVSNGRATRRRSAGATVTITPERSGATAPRDGSGPGQGQGQGPRGGAPDFNALPRSLPTRGAVDPVVDGFTAAIFRDDVTGDTLAYNLFVPPDRDPGKPLPIVLFMHDAGNTSPVVDTTLVQGLGAVGWAGAEDQARSPAIVLAPQYASATVDDRSNASSLLDTTLHLLDHIVARHGGDRRRLYITGQSGGGMMAIAMMVKRPDLFAAGFLVACQWDPAVVAPLARQKLWVMVAQGDARALPGQNAIMQVVEGRGTAVSRATWDGRWDAAAFARAVAAQAGEGRAVNYTVLGTGTVVPAGQADDPGSNHVNTWRIAYDIPGIRAWIMRQVRPA